jgi:hypothetical protein
MPVVEIQGLGGRRQPHNVLVGAGRERHPCDPQEVLAAVLQRPQRGGTRVRTRE